jgi:tetratricopeptide (TPR) repeat protein
MTAFRILCIAAACALTAPILASAQGIGTVEHSLSYGRDYLAEGNPSSAATYFRLAVRQYPDNAEAHLLLAIALQRSGHLEEARSYLEKAISLDPGLGTSTDGRSVAEALRKSNGTNDQQTTIRDEMLPAPVPQPTGPVGSEYDNATFGGGGPGYDIKRGREELALGGYDHAETYFRLERFPLILVHSRRI